MNRSFAVLVLLLLGGRALASPESEAANQAGKARFSSGDYAGAADDFRHAIAIEFQPKYAYNLCNALDKQGRYDEALAACDRVFTSPDADEDLKAKATIITENIYRKRKHQAVELHADRPVDRPTIELGREQQHTDEGDEADDDAASRFRWGMRANLGRYGNGPLAISDESEYVLKVDLEKPVIRSGMGILALGVDLMRAPDATRGPDQGYAVRLGWHQQVRRGRLVYRPFSIDAGVAWGLAHGNEDHLDMTLPEDLEAATFFLLEVSGSVGLCITDALIVNAGVFFQAFYGADDVRGGTLLSAGLEYRIL